MSTAATTRTITPATKGTVAGHLLTFTHPTRGTHTTVWADARSLRPMGAYIARWVRMGWTAEVGFASGQRKTYPAR